MTKLFFACGAHYEIKNVPTEKRFVTFVAGGDTKPPTKDGKAMNCWVGCPARVKDSGRKEFKAWVGKTEADVQDCSSEPKTVVSCRPVRIEKE